MLISLKTCVTDHPYIIIIKEEVKKKEEPKKEEPKKAVQVIMDFSIVLFLQFCCPTSFMTNIARTMYKATSSSLALPLPYVEYNVLAVPRQPMGT